MIPGCSGCGTSSEVTSDTSDSEKETSAKRRKVERTQRRGRGTRACGQGHSRGRGLAKAKVAGVVDVNVVLLGVKVTLLLSLPGTFDNIHVPQNNATCSYQYMLFVSRC